MDKYNTVKTIGDGTYGSVIKAMNRRTGEIVAIKKMKKKYFKWNQCSFLPNPQDAKMIHIRTKKPGHLTGSWETGDKRPKIENYYDLKMKGII